MHSKKKKRKEENLGFKIRRRPNGRIRPVCITDLDLPDDIALISKQFKHAQTLRDRVELVETAKDLIANTKKPKVMTFTCPSKINIYQ